MNKIYELKGLVYLSHPYGGDPEAVESTGDIFRQLQAAHPESTVISPLHNFAPLAYRDEDYIPGLDMCLDLLRYCQHIVMSGDWQRSRGCCAEYAFARAKGIEIWKSTPDSKLDCVHRYKP